MLDRREMCDSVSACTMFCAHFCNLVFLPPTLHSRVSVLVGAPKANTSQPGILEAGAVYYCPWPGLPDSCRQIPFDNSSESSQKIVTWFVLQNQRKSIYLFRIE